MKCGETPKYHRKSKKGKISIIEVVKEDWKTNGELQGFP